MLVACSEELLIFFGQRDLYHRIVLLGAENDAHCWLLVFGTLEPIEPIHVHHHLTEVLVCELPELEVNEDKAAQQPIVENQVNIEVIAFDAQTLLARHETETLAEFQKELLEAIDDGLFEVPLEPGVAFGQVKKL